MNWLTYALAAVAINTTLVLSLRVLSKKSTNPRITGFIYNSYAALVSVCIWIISGAPLPSNVPLYAIGLLLFSALGYGIFQRGQFYLRKKVEASELVPVSQMGLIAGFVASIIILHEPVSPKKLLGVLIVVSATLIVSLNRKLTINKYALTAIGISSALSIAGVIDKYNSSNYPFFFYIMLIWIIPLPFILLPVKRGEIHTAIKEAGWQTPVLATLNVLSLIFFVRALQLGQASSIIPILGTVTVLSVLGGIVILGETKYWGRKLIAGLLATIGIIILR